VNEYRSPISRNQSGCDRQRPTFRRLLRLLPTIGSFPTRAEREEISRGLARCLFFDKILYMRLV